LGTDAAVNAALAGGPSGPASEERRRGEQSQQAVPRARAEELAPALILLRKHTHTHRLKDNKNSVGQEQKTCYGSFVNY
jgi:hypothetical protein